MDAAAVVEKNENVMTDLSGLLEGKIDFPKLLEQQREDILTRWKTWISYCSQYEKFMFETDWPLANYGDYIEVVKWLIRRKSGRKSLRECKEDLTDFKNCSGDRPVLKLKSL